MDNVSDNQKVRIALIHLYEKALDWHKHFERMNGLEVTWERYEEEVLKRFRAVVEDPMAISMFLGGMNTDIVMMVRKFKPRTLADTYCLENLQKATNESRTKYKPVYPGYKNVASTSSVVMVVMFVLEVLAALDEEEEEIIEEECLAEEVNPDLQKAKQLGCKLKASYPLQVSVASGIQLGVAIDPVKIKAMLEWPIPVNLKQLREIDASGYGIEQYYNKRVIPLPISARHWLLNTTPCLITTSFQSKWLPKLLGFDYEIEYKKGKENVVVDALSMVQQQGQLF
ncbi:hypothetical protein Tco_0614738 [Tanacetum coccineum]